MKNLLLLSLLFFTTIAFAQTVRRVNADATVTGINVYQTLQAAHDAATAGDVLIVEPGASVGNLTCTKTLTIYGRGYWLDKNTSYATLPNNASASTVGIIEINANNVKLSGVVSSTISINGVSGVTVSRCYFTANLWVNGLTSAPASNVTISQNVLSGYITLTGTATGTVSNVTITNNLFGSVGNYFLIDNQYCSGILFNQNSVTNSVISGVWYNTAFTNNIFTNGLVITNSTLSNSIFSYNVFTSTSTYSASTGSNNIFQTNLSAQFASNTSSDDNPFRIINGSPLKTAGNTGGEVGMFGGATPYVQYGIPPGPALLKLLNSGLGNSTTPINATISAVSNN